MPPRVGDAVVARHDWSPWRDGNLQVWFALDVRSVSRQPDRAKMDGATATLQAVVTIPRHAAGYPSVLGVVASQRQQHGGRTSRVNEVSTSLLYRNVDIASIAHPGRLTDSRGQTASPEPHARDLDQARQGPLAGW